MSVYWVWFQFGKIRKFWRWKVAMFAQLNVVGTAHLQAVKTVPFYVMWILPNQTSHMLTVHRRRRHNTWSCVVPPELSSAHTSLQSEMTSSQFLPGLGGLEFIKLSLSNVPHGPVLRFLILPTNSECWLKSQLLPSPRPAPSAKSVLSAMTQLQSFLFFC